MLSPVLNVPVCSLPCAEAGVEVAYLSEDGSGSNTGGGTTSRLSRMHSRAHSSSSAASWDSSLPSHSRSGSRAAGLDAQGAYMEASVSRMLSSTRDRWDRGWVMVGGG